MSKTKRQQILDMLHESGILRPRDVESVGIFGAYMNKLHAEGLLDRPSLGSAFSRTPSQASTEQSLKPAIAFLTGLSAC